jgi:DNA-binding MarR family transcriptional regulator
MRALSAGAVCLGGAAIVLTLGAAGAAVAQGKDLKAVDRVPTVTFDAALLAAGCVSYDTYDVLITLSEAPGHRLRMSELAGATFFSNSGISRRVGRLEKEGYLRREGCESDGRVFYAVLTEAGKDALRLAWPVYEQVIEEDFAKAMSAPEARELSRILKSVVTKIDGTLAGEKTEEPRC